MSKSLNRILAPALKEVTKIPFVFPESHGFKNGSSLYFYTDPESEVVRIEFMYPAGSKFASKRLQAGFTNKLLSSGSKKYSSKQISEMLDYYGAYFEKHSGPDFASLTLYSLTKYVEPLLEIVSELIREAIFPEHELDTQLKIKRQKFLVSSQKVNSMAKKEFTYLLFGAGKPYGGKTTIEDYDQLSREDLLSFFKQHYMNPPVVMAAGGLNDSILKSIEKNFGGIEGSLNWDPIEYHPLNLSGERKVFEKKGSVQSAIRMGRRLFNRNHDDYAEMTVLSTILGGYFGSRLMSNLREDKGFTYGVGCGLTSLQQDGTFYIASEVGTDVTLLAEKEILSELRQMREELIPEYELSTVKSYLMGEFLRSSDGVFSNMDRFKSMWLYKQKEGRFQEVIEKIRLVSPERLRDLANTYLQEDSLITVIAGKA